MTERLKLDNMIAADSSPFINFSDGTEEGIHLLNDGQANYVVIDREVPYPHADSSGLALQGLLLPEREAEGGMRALQLPDNLATMGHALNDVFGDSASERGAKMAYGLFERVGKSLAKVAIQESIVLPHLSYKNIIFSRENQDFKLLPPIEFVKFAKNDSDVAKRQVVQSFRKSLEEVASSHDQKCQSMKAFAGFLREFEGE